MNSNVSFFKKIVLVIVIIVIATLVTFFIAQRNNGLVNDLDDVTSEKINFDKAYTAYDILSAIRQRSGIAFDAITYKDVTEFTDTEIITYEGEWMMAQNVATSLIESHINDYLVNEGFEVKSDGGVGGAQNLGGKKFERDKIFCTTMYGVGSDISGVTIACASRDNVKERVQMK